MKAPINLRRLPAAILGGLGLLLGGALVAAHGEARSLHDIPWYMAGGVSRCRSASWLALRRSSAGSRWCSRTWEAAGCSEDRLMDEARKARAKVCELERAIWTRVETVGREARAADSAAVTASVAATAGTDVRQDMDVHRC